MVGRGWTLEVSVGEKQRLMLWRLKDSIILRGEEGKEDRSDDEGVLIYEEKMASALVAKKQ